MQNRLVERLEKNDVVLCGEGYVFELERRGYLKAGPFVPEVVLDFPDVVKQLHREYMRAGSDIVLALSYYAHRDKLKVIGREADLEEINRVGVRLARDVADEGDALVAGGLCNSWVYDPANAKETGRLVRAMYEEQVRWAVDEGVDLILAETLNHVGEAEIALELIQEAGLPSVINFFPLNEKTGDGFTFGDACKRLSDLGATVVGLNCGRGPATITSFLEDVINSVDTYVGVLPITYRTDASNPNFLTLKHEDCRCGFPIELEPFLLGRFMKWRISRCRRGNLGRASSAYVVAGRRTMSAPWLKHLDGRCLRAGIHRICRSTQYLARTRSFMITKKADLRTKLRRFTVSKSPT